MNIRDVNEAFPVMTDFMIAFRLNADETSMTRIDMFLWATVS